MTPLSTSAKWTTSNFPKIESTLATENVPFFTLGDATDSAPKIKQIILPELLYSQRHDTFCKQIRSRLYGGTAAIFIR